ncbi:MAG: MarR family winged helix-turn-helix transcriptional regulator [Saprospiraceae bacterium]
MRESKKIALKEFKSDYTNACINILYTSSFILKMKTQTLRPFNISLQQFNILDVLNNQYPESSTVKPLAEQMLDETSNVSRLVDKLNTKGLVKRTSALKDRRKVEISITKKGLAVFQKAALALENVTEFQLGNLSKSEVALLNQLLNKTRAKGNETL